MKYPLHTIEAIAEAYLDDCSGMFDQPVVLLGICFGSAVVLEMAHRLTAINQQPVLVVVIDPSVDDESESTSLARPQMPTIWSFLADRLRLAIAAFRAQSGMERLHFLRKKFGTLLRKIRHRDLLSGNRLELKQRGVRSANMAAAQQYRQTRYSGPICVLITGDRDIESNLDPRIEWINRVQRESLVVRIPGRDTGDVLGNYVYELASHIRQQTDAVCEESIANEH